MKKTGTQLEFAAANGLLDRRFFLAGGAGLAALAAQVQAAQRKFDTDTDPSVVPPLVAGLRAARVVRSQLRAMGLDESARFEIDVRLRQKEREIQQAILAASGIRVEALADDGVVVPAM